MYGSDSQNCEEISGNCCAVNTLWLIGAGHIHIACTIRGNLFEGLALGFPIEVVGRSHRALLPCRDGHQTMKIGQSKRSHQKGFGETENGGVHADSQRQSKQRGHCEAGVFAEHARAVVHVLAQSFQERQSAAFAIKLFGLFNATELDQCLAACFWGAHAVRRFFLVCIWRWLSISAASSRSRRSLRKRPASRRSSARSRLMRIPFQSLGSAPELPKF